MFVVRPWRALRSLALVVVVAAGCVSWAAPAFADDVPAGQTVVGTVVHAFVEHRNEQDAGAKTDFGAPLTYIDPGVGSSVRVPTAALADVPVGATVKVKVGATVEDSPATTDHLAPAQQVLSASVVAPATEATNPPVTDSVSIAMVVPAGATRDATSLATVVSQVSGPVASFWAQQTNGAIQIGVADTHDWGTVTTALDCSDPTALWDDVARQVGFTPGPGKHLMLYLPTNSPGCSYGLAEVGAGLHAGGYLYVTDTPTSVIAHELGHNFGLLHSGATECQGTVEGGTCHVDEYGDLYDVMAASWSQVGSLNAVQAARLGVLPAAQVQDVAFSDTGGTYTVAPLSGTTGIRAIRLDGTSGRVYYLEYRVAGGQDAYLGDPSANWLGLPQGVLLHRVETASAADSAMLLDGTPTGGAGYASDSDDVLPLGVPVPVSDGAIQITVRSATATGAQIEIEASPGAEMHPATQISAGQALVSAVAHYRARITTDGDLAVTSPDGRVFWAAGVHAPGGTLAMQGDGNLVVYARNGVPAWNSGTAGNPGAELAMQDDGNLVIYRADGTPAWATGAYRPELLGTNLQLQSGQSLTSAAGGYRASFTTDGDLAVTSPGGRVFWSAGVRAPGGSLAMQADGNLVVYARNGVPVWSSGTSGGRGSQLAMQADGNLVLYRADGTPVWATGPYRPELLGTNGQLQGGQSLPSADGRYQAAFQGDGNFVVYGPGGRVLWASMVFARGAVLVMQSDGNLVSYSGSGLAVWATGTRSAAGAHLAMQNDGNLVLYRADGRALWATGPDTRR